MLRKILIQVDKTKRFNWILIAILTTMCTLKLYCNNHYDADKIRAAVVAVKHNYYYELKSNSVSLFFSGISPNGLIGISHNPQQATDSIVSGGFYIDEQGVIITTNVIGGVNKIKHEEITRAIETEIMRIRAELTLFNNQLSGKSHYVGGHVEEDEGYDEMLYFYQERENLRAHHTKVLSQLLLMAQSPQIVLHQQIQVVCNGVLKPAIPLAQGDHISIIELHDKVTPKPYVPLKLPQRELQSSFKNEKDFYQIVTPGHYLSMHKGEIPSHFTKNNAHKDMAILKGIVLREDSEMIYTTLPTIDKMQGFPILNKKGSLEAVIIPNGKPFCSETKGVRVEEIHKLLAEINYEIR